MPWITQFLDNSLLACFIFPLTIKFLTKVDEIIFLSLLSGLGFTTLKLYLFPYLINCFTFPFRLFPNLKLLLTKINFGLKFLSLSVKNNDTKLLNENLFGVSAGTNLLKDKNSSLAIGVSANYYLIQFGKSAGVSGDGSDGLNSEVISSIRLDIGFLGSLREKNRLGVFIKNINSPIIGDGMSIQNLPRKIHI